MKKKAVLPILTLVVLIASTALAAAPASDNAADTVYNDGWQTGDNGGSGMGAWTLVANGSAGHFVATSTENGDGDSNGDGDIDTGGRAWGLWANSNGMAEALRPFLTPLAAGETLTIQMDTGWIDSPGHVDFGLLNAADGVLFEVYFLGGGSNYYVWDASSATHDTGIGWTDEGLTIEFTLTDADSYSVTLTRIEDSVSATLTGDLVNPVGGQDVSQIYLLNFTAGFDSPRNAYFNSISVSGPSAVELASFTAAPQGDNILLQWETATELDNLGFNLYRAGSPDGTRVQLNAHLIPAAHPGSVAGATYQFADEAVVSGVTYYYWLEDVDLHGTATLHGPVQTRMDALMRLLPVRPRLQPSASIQNRR